METGETSETCSRDDALCEGVVSDHGTGRVTESKEALLQKYARKPIRGLLQIDGFIGQQRDDFFRPDSDGDDVWSSLVRDLRWTGMEQGLAVRIQVSDGAQPDDVQRLLKKMGKAITYSLKLREEAIRRHSRKAAYGPHYATASATRARGRPRESTQRTSKQAARNPISFGSRRDKRRSPKEPRERSS